uniref:Retroviral polymerase SH3-like domain-containing protein n=1 Tax=Peronospora matthiolae TaxID=2874970 RepID=A0AAV1T3B3_9STRA
MKKALSNPYYKGVSTEWWAEAVSTAVYLINRSINTAHADSTPYKLSFKVKLHMEYLRVFGLQGYAHVDDARRTKLESKKFSCMFLGYAVTVNGYHLFGLDDSKVKTSWSVKLDEREVGGIYDTQKSQLGMVTQIKEPIPDAEMDDVEPEEEDF